MGERKSVIHIGLQKVGSTTLQRGLFMLRDQLPSQGFLYPCNYLPHREQHSDLTLFLRRGAMEEYERGIVHILESAACVADAELILSGEDFAMIDARKLEIFHRDLCRTGRRFHVIIYMRNLYRFAMSWIAHRSQTGEAILYPPSMLDRTGSFQPASIIAKWERFFGEDYVSVFSLEALPGHKDIVSHFASFAGIQLPCGFSVPELNRSVDPIASMLLNHLAFEFGVPNALFSNAYFQSTGRQFLLPKMEEHLLHILDQWVEARDLTHPKLEPLREILLRRPMASPEHKARMPTATEYLNALSATLSKVARDHEARARRLANEESDAKG